MLHLLVIHGPNLNMLKQREPSIYGDLSLDELNKKIRQAAPKGVSLDFFQSNIEGEIVERLQRARGQVAGVVINAAGYTHTSVAIRDAIAAIELPVVEVHLSNVHAREEFRRTSLIAPVCVGQVAGFGYMSYVLGIAALEERLTRSRD